jgi:hypothetical protein
LAHRCRDFLEGFSVAEQDIVYERFFRDYKQARKIVIAILGGSILLIGIFMLLLPGPAVIVIPAGLTLLATEFDWARRVLARVKKNFQTDPKEKPEEKSKQGRT